MARFPAQLGAALVALTAGIGGSPAALAQSGVRVDENRVHAWNTFADRLLQTHRNRIQSMAVTKSETVGGYANRPKFYREIAFRSQTTGLPVSRIWWERETPENMHAIELYFHDEQGRLKLDYRAAYLPKFRNAPIQTLVNVHHYDDDLQSFRQFDASGVVIFERCKGDYFGEAVDLNLDEGVVPSPAVVPTQLYVSCFGMLPLRADAFLDPRAFAMKGGFPVSEGHGTDDKGADRALVELNAKIQTNPTDALALARRGHLLFTRQRLDDALADFNRAIEINDDVDAAYFGRGMVLGRMERLAEAIRDLSIYIERNPESSLAYTKRGVRHIWSKDFERARKDLEMAVFLDESNAEAHDDLGVALAQLGDTDGALSHFLKARDLDPGYQKVHHNLGMVYFMTQDLQRALKSVDQSLRLQDDNRSSLLLKATILEAMGRRGEADTLRQRAEALPSGNWSERSGLQ